MNSAPIIFTAPMVRAILEGRKTQTRRVIRPQPPYECAFEVGVYSPTKSDRRGEAYPGPDVFGVYSLDGEWGRACPYGQPGDLLWVRETFCRAYRTGYDARPDGGEWWYRATDSGECEGPWSPAIYMPREACRILLRITNVRVERVQNIAASDAIAEGATSRPNCCGYGQQEPGWSMDWSEVGRSSRWVPSGVLTESDIALDTPVLAFRQYWDRLHARRGFGWDANPWVWAISFERVRGDG